MRDKKARPSQPTGKKYYTAENLGYHNNMTDRCHFDVFCLGGEFFRNSHQGRTSFTCWMHITSDLVEVLLGQSP